jgi:hypothetical protein
MPHAKELLEIVVTGHYLIGVLLARRPESSEAPHGREAAAAAAGAAAALEAPGGPAPLFNGRSAALGQNRPRAYPALYGALRPTPTRWTRTLRSSASPRAAPHMPSV